MEKKWIYIVVAIVVVLAVAGALATKIMWMGNGVNYQQNTDGSQTYSNEQGSVTVGTTTMPTTWPNDLPDNYSGAMITYSANSSPQSGKPGAAVAYTVKGATPQAVAAYYRGTLAAKGWKIAGDANVGSQVVLGATKDTRTFAMSIVGDANGNVTVTAGVELQQQ